MPPDNFETPVAYLFFSRPKCIQISFQNICNIRPKKLYLIADGPRTKKEEETCNESRKLVEGLVDWECEVVKFYSDINLGLAKRTVSGLNSVFQLEEKIIFIEEDNYVDPTFFSFCQTLLDYYEDNESIFQIGGCNFFPEAIPSQTKADYIFSGRSICWSFATWKRAWQHMDLTMKNWANEDKISFLKKHCVSSHHLRGMLKIFDQHCQNEDPWAWSYAWIYTCWAHNSLTIIPKVNLVSNIGFGPDATNTVMKSSNWEGIPAKRGSIHQITHPNEISRHPTYEKTYDALERGTLLRRFKQFVKGILRK